MIAYLDKAASRQRRINPVRNMLWGFDCLVGVGAPFQGGDNVSVELAKTSDKTKHGCTKKKNVDEENTISSLAGGKSEDLSKPCACSKLLLLFQGNHVQVVTERQQPRQVSLARAKVNDSALLTTRFCRSCSHNLAI